jgi:transglutaminase-like putative cysteine protease
LRRIVHPREGWLAAGLLFVLLLSLSWSVQAAGWLDQADFLVPVAFWALIVGSLLALTGWSVAITIPIAALIGAGIVIWAVGGEYFPVDGQLGRLAALRADGLLFTATALHRGLPVQVTPFALGMGLVMWTTAVTAAQAMYRYHRTMDAIVLLAVLLIGNMAATRLDLFSYLLLFVLAAMLLWLRASLLGREEGWQLRRITENPDVPASILRAGIAFTAASIGLAWLMTSVAVAAPLTAAVQSLDVVWTQVRDQVGGLFGGLENGQARLASTGFGSQLVISDEWTSRDTPVLILTATRAHYLATVTYDRYTGRGWETSDRQSRTVVAGAPTFVGPTPDRPIFGDAFDTETVTIEFAEARGRNLFTPGFPLRIFAPVEVTELANAAVFTALASTGGISPGQGYQIEATISQATEAELAAAGTAYPNEVVAYYLDVTGLTNRTIELAREIAGDAADPYHQAKALADYLRRDESGFEYSTHAPLPTDPNQDFVDFFLFDSKVGFCEHYASALAMMARSLGIPARLVAGYAPGERVTTGVYQVRDRNAHAWVELYFPGYGWQALEATRSLAPITRPTGNPLVVPPPVSGTEDIPSPFDEFEDPVPLQSPPASFEPISGGFIPGDEPPADNSRLVQGWILLGLIAAAALYGAWRWLGLRRRFRFLAPADRQWARLTLAAERAGVARRPGETYYEYADWLEQEIPTRSDEIRTIAEGKVWQSYSGRSMSEVAIEGIERAWSRLRLPLSWLAIRRRIGPLFSRRI